MRRKDLLSLTLVSLIAISTTGCSRHGGMMATKGTGKEISLQMHLEKGQDLIFDSKKTTTQKAKGQSIEIQGSVVYAIQVVEKTPEGFTTNLMIKDFSIRLPKGFEGREKIEQTASSVKGTVIEETFDDRGNSKAFSVKSNSPMAQTIGNGIAGSNIGFMGVIYPENQVSVGSTWEASIDYGTIMDRMKAGLKIKGKSAIPVKFKLSKIEELNGKTIAVVDYSMMGTIELDMSSTPSGGTATIESEDKGSMRIDVSTGVVVESTRSAKTTTKAKSQTTEQTIEGSMKLRSK